MPTNSSTCAGISLARGFQIALSPQQDPWALGVIRGATSSLWWPTFPTKAGLLVDFDSYLQYPVHGARSFQARDWSASSRT